MKLLFRSVVMKKRAKPVQQMESSFDNKPAKQRILEASDKVFRLYGIRAGIGGIAYQANSNTDHEGEAVDNGERSDNRKEHLNRHSNPLLVAARIRSRP
jgi:hypothetical protein